MLQTTAGREYLLLKTLLKYNDNNFLSVNFYSNKSNALMNINHGEFMREKFYKKNENSRISVKK
jgi:hypothetical protein